MKWYSKQQHYHFFLARTHDVDGKSLPEAPTTQLPEAYNGYRKCFPFIK